MADNKKEIFRTIKFTLCSVSAAVIQMGSFALLNELLELKYWISYLISLILSVLWNFTLNRKFTFQSAGNIPVAMIKTLLFYVVFTPLSTWWTKVFTEDLLVNAYIVEIGTMLINFASEYLYQRFFVFGKTIDTAKKE